VAALMRLNKDVFVTHPFGTAKLKRGASTKSDNFAMGGNITMLHN
jgi:hypothetical protein